MTDTDPEYEHLRQLVGWTVSHPVAIKYEDASEYDETLYALVLRKPRQQAPADDRHYLPRPRGQRPWLPRDPKGEVRNMNTEDLDDLTIDLAIDIIRTLRAERDEARREIAHRVFVSGGLRPAEFAKSRGWDCFKEDLK